MCDDIRWNSVITYPQGKWKKVRSKQSTFYPKQRKGIKGRLAISVIDGENGNNRMYVLSRVRTNRFSLYLHINAWLVAMTINNNNATKNMWSVRSDVTCTSSTLILCSNLFKTYLWRVCFLVAQPNRHASTGIISLHYFLLCTHIALFSCPHQACTSSQTNIFAVLFFVHFCCRCLFPNVQICSIPWFKNCDRCRAYGWVFTQVFNSIAIRIVCFSTWACVSAIPIDIVSQRAPYRHKKAVLVALSFTQSAFFRQVSSMRCQPVRIEHSHFEN